MSVKGKQQNERGKQSHSEHHTLSKFRYRIILIQVYSNCNNCMHTCTVIYCKIRKILHVFRNCKCITIKNRNVSCMYTHS